MNQLLISVIIPTYNRANYVGAAVQSALAQTYPNVEVIVVDDGSTDNTRDVLAEFGSRITYVHKENEGTAAAARNVAMRHARGEYIALLDSDDVWLPDKLTLQMQFVRQHPEVGLVSGHVGSIDANGDLKNPGPLHPWQRGCFVRPEDIVLRSPLHASTLLVKRAYMNRSLPFDPRFRICEDWHLCLTVAARAPVGFVDHVVAYLRGHENRSTNPLVDGAEVAERLDHRLTVVEEVFPLFDPRQADLPRLKAQIIAQEYAQAAVPNYVNGLHDLAAEQLREAVQLDPFTWRDGLALADMIHKYAVLIAKARGDAAAVTFLREVIGNLPSELKGLKHLRRTALGDAHIELGFLSHQRGKRHLVRKHVLAGLYYNPKWLRNRGVISILIRSLFS